MDLKEFILETVSSVIDASAELTSRYSAAGVTINPPSEFNGNQNFVPEDPRYKYRRVLNVEFDVALSATSVTDGGAKAAVKLAVVEASTGAAHQRSKEEVSRVRFTLPMSLPPSGIELQNRDQSASKTNTRVVGPY